MVKPQRGLGEPKKQEKTINFYLTCIMLETQKNMEFEDITKRMGRGQSTITVREPMTLKPGDTVGINVRLDPWGR